MLDPVLLVAFAAALTAAAFRAVRDRPPLLFMGAWLSLVLAGAVLWVPAGIGPAAVSFLSPIFPAAQLAGVLALLYGRAPAAVAGVAIAVGVARGVLGARFPALELAIGLTIEPATSLAAAALLARNAPHDRARMSWLAAAAVIGLAGLADGASAYAREVDGRVPVPLAAGWLMLASAGLPLQLQLQARRDQARQTGLRRRVEAELSESRERFVGSSRVDLQACKLEYSIVSPK